MVATTCVVPTRGNEQFCGTLLKNGMGLLSWMSRIYYKVEIKMKKIIVNITSQTR